MRIQRWIFFLHQPAKEKQPREEEKFGNIKKVVIQRRTDNTIVKMKKDKQTYMYNGQQNTMYSDPMISHIWLSWTRN